MSEYLGKAKDWAVQNWEIIVIALGIVAAIALIWYFSSLGKATKGEGKSEV